MKHKKVAAFVAGIALVAAGMSACSGYSNSEKETILTRLNDAGIEVPAGDFNKVLGSEEVAWYNGDPHYGICPVDEIWLVGQDLHIVFDWSNGKEFINPTDAQLREHPATKDCK